MIKINTGLKDIRKSKGYSQEQVADYIGIDTTNYGRIERGQTSITFDRLFQLSELYKLNIIEFVAILTNSKLSNSKESSELSHLLETIDYLKKEVAFLRESLLTKDSQISYLIELNKEFKKINPRKTNTTVS